MKQSALNKFTFVLGRDERFFLFLKNSKQTQLSNKQPVENINKTSQLRLNIPCISSRRHAPGSKLTSTYGQKDVILNQFLDFHFHRKNNARAQGFVPLGARCSNGRVLPTTGA